MNNGAFTPSRKAVPYTRVLAAPRHGLLRQAETDLFHARQRSARSPPRIEYYVVNPSPPGVNAMSERRFSTIFTKWNGKYTDYTCTCISWHLRHHDSENGWWRNRFVNFWIFLPAVQYRPAAYVTYRPRNCHVGPVTARRWPRPTPFLENVPKWSSTNFRKFILKWDRVYNIVALIQMGHSLQFKISDCWPLVAHLYRQLRTRRALSIFKDVPLRTKRALSLFKVYGDSALLSLTGTYLNSNNALLVLNWRYDHYQWRHQGGAWGGKCPPS